MCLSIMKAGARRLQPGAREGCLRHPRVWGVGFGWLKGQARNRWTGSEHAARDDPVIPWVVQSIWNTNTALSR